MKRREVLVSGAGVLSIGLSGCLDSAGSAGKDDTTQTTESTTTSAAATTTTKPGKEAFVLLNDDPNAHRVHVTVSLQSDGGNRLVDSTYEVPSQYILEFTDLLEHGREYHFEITTAKGKSATKTLTAKGCAGDQYNSSGDRSIVAWVSGKPGVSYNACDTPFPPKYTRSWAEQYEVSETTPETTATSTTTTTTS
ncbi:hypothetical protein [Haladaptatus sp. DFWS20]|uniref:hypothetical protein n=1 Tax=Haladaptatus sp. DFWS20 TaxID=3403467 RepID=UPI003EBA4B85